MLGRLNTQSFVARIRRSVCVKFQEDFNPKKFYVQLDIVSQFIGHIFYVKSNSAARFTSSVMTNHIKVWIWKSLCKCLSVNHVYLRPRTSNLEFRTTISTSSNLLSRLRMFHLEKRHPFGTLLDKNVLVNKEWLMVVSPPNMLVMLQSKFHMKSYAVFPTMTFPPRQFLWQELKHHV